MKQMKIGIGTGYIARYGLTEGVRRMRAHGYDCIDYDMANTETDLYLFSGEAFEKKAIDVRRAIENAGITVGQTHGPWRFPPKDETEEDRRERFEKMSLSIRATGLLGCRHFVIHPIMPFGCWQDPDPDAFMKINRDFFRRLLRVAEENDVVICLENMPMPALPVATPETVLRFAQEMNSPFFKVCLDTGHCTVCGCDPADAVRLLGKDYLYALHVHDNDGKGDRHWMPYEGVIRWDNFAASLQDVGFDGTVSLETYVPSDVPEATWEDTEKQLARAALRLAGRA